MIIKFDCPGCGHSLNGEAELEFQTVTCPICQLQFSPKPFKTFYQIPKLAEASEAIPPNARPEKWINCFCTVCFGKLEFDDTARGETVQCLHCGADTVLFNPQPIIATTGNEISGRLIESYVGIARGVVVRSPNIVQGVFGGLKQIVGGNIESYAKVCEEARQQAFNRMIEQAQLMKADAIIAMRYDATEFAPGITEVLAYGTAVKLAGV